MNAPLSPAVLTSGSPASYCNVGSMGCYSNNPVADAIDYYDALADDEASTQEVEIEYCGIELVVTLSRHQQNVFDMVTADSGEDMMSEFSEYAHSNIFKKAMAVLVARGTAW